VEHLARYQELVAACQSPHFTSEAARLSELIGRYIPASWSRVN